MPALIPFPQFFAAIHGAQYADYAARPRSQVVSLEAFTAMQAYLLQRYAEVQVVSSIRVENQIFDCVVTRDAQTVPLRLKSAACPDGTIPMRRITLEELTRFRTLRDFLGKSPGGKATR